MSRRLQLSRMLGRTRRCRRHTRRSRDIAASRSTVYQQSLRNYHSRRLRPRSFVEGDLVLRLKQRRPNKLDSPWEGPYAITEVIPGGAYRLKHVESGVAYSNPWNIAQL